ncbi:MAG: hypothetical protein GWN11_04860 [Candidatus Dadabacteria bacterium]|nr:hypothetical protein [Candidatus Dadabacteria bacterium]NIX15208.1 hypothetical protein [Candidatus Dadabacteria bacterium]
MNKIYLYLFFIFVLFVFVIFQTTLFSPSHLGRFYIDLTLMLVVYLSLNSEIRGGVFLVFLSGYMLDLFSGTNMGLYVFSRLSLYLIIRFLITKIYSDRVGVHILIIFLSIIYEWAVLALVFSFSSQLNTAISVNFIIINILINTFAGYICFNILKDLHGKLHS